MFGFPVILQKKGNCLLQNRRYNISPSLFRWFESNCTMQPGVGMTKMLRWYDVIQVSNSIFRDGHMGTL